MILIIITLAFFRSVTNHEFLRYDDHVNVFENPYMHNVNISKILHFWKKPYYYALTHTVWAFQAIFAKTPAKNAAGMNLDPHIFHITNLILHILSVLIVFSILRLLTKNDWASCAGALLFALHPVQVEPVAWVTGLKDVLSGFLSLVAIWQYILYVKLKSNKEINKGNNTHRPKIKNQIYHYIIATVAFALAMLSKPTAVVVPAIIWILDYWILKQKFRKSLSLLVGWIFLAIPIVVWAKLAQPDKALSFIPSPWAVRPLIAGDALTFYFYKLILPISLYPDYGRTPQFVLQNKWIYVTPIIPVALVILCYLKRKQWPYLCTSIGIFIAGVLPVLGLIPFSFQGISTVADRYLYLSMLGPALLLSFLLLHNRKKIIGIICVLILFLLGIRASSQAQYWYNSMKLFQHTVKLNTRSFLSYFILGIVSEKQGNTEQAITHYYRTLDIRPDYEKAHYNLGIILAKQNIFNNAIYHFSETIKLNPYHYEAFNNLGITFAMQGKHEKAVSNYSKALNINPDYVEAYNNLGIVLENQGKYKEALALYFKALKKNPNLVELHYNIGILLSRQGRTDEAIEHYNEALNKRPGWVEIHYNLGLLLAFKGKLNEAITHFSKATKLNPNYYQAHNNLGFILEKQGNIEKAIYHYSEASRINPNYLKAKDNLIRAQEKQSRQNR